MIGCKDVSVQSGDSCLERVSFHIPRGSYGVLMGPTGCGKSTILETICGLRRPASGTVELDGVDVTQTSACDRGIGYVPQEAAVFPRMTVRDNLGFALRVRNVNRDAIYAKVESLATSLNIQHLLDRKGAVLSGGESQRVALGRALAAEPAVLLLDEPLSGMDEATRSRMVALLKNVHAKASATVLHVTHNLQEAIDLADTLLKFDNGRLVDVSAPEESGEKNLPSELPHCRPSTPPRQATAG